MTGEMPVKKGTVLATKKVEEGDWLYRGDVVVGESPDERILVFSSYGKGLDCGSEPPYHVRFSAVPDKIRETIMTSLKYLKPRLPNRTLEAKDYLRMVYGS